MMHRGELTSERFEVEDAYAAIELYFERGWTDGLPVVPPTPDLVARFLEAAALEPDEVLGTVPLRSRVVTAEKAAINAVMAGCRPEYMPVIVAAVRAMTREAFHLHSATASMGGASLLVIVNGPAVKKLDFNCGYNFFGPGWRANATVGRAIRLILMNVCGARPGVLDRSALGSPAKYTYCVAENEDESPWEPLHVERGCAPEESAVTVFAADAPQQVSNLLSDTPEGILTTAADVMCHLGLFKGGTRLYAVGPEHRQVFAERGWTKADIRAWFAEHAVRSLADLKRGGKREGPVEPGDEAILLNPFPKPEDVLILSAGSGPGPFSAIVPSWGGGDTSRPQTEVFEVP